jgi:hypothetical protein
MTPPFPTLPNLIWDVRDAAMTDVSGAVLSTPHAPPSPRATDRLVAVTPDDLIRPADLDAALASHGKARLLMLTEVESADLKSGRLFHGLLRLRDAGRAEAIGIEATDYRNAEWMIENTPTKAVLLAYDLVDPSASYRLLDTAAGMRTAILARPAVTRPEGWSPGVDALTSLRFTLADARVRSAVVAYADVFGDATPLSPEAHADWLARFRAAVPEPAKPRSGHPPEE